MFRYPVTAEEIRLFLDHTTDPLTIEMALGSLTAKKQVFALDEFYSLQNDISLIERRRKGNAHAEELLSIAYRIGRRLYKFPFVRGVGISGSLSKNYADADADIDFFIITASDRTWLARTLLHLLKKISFLSGKQDWYCMNYFIDEKALIIAEKNIFTATEVATLKPVCGPALAGFNMANSWAFDLLPNHRRDKTGYTKEVYDTWYKRIVEKIFSNGIGERLDNYLMRVTVKRWQKKEQDHQLNSKGDPVGIVAGKHFARPNPEHLQRKLLGMFNSRLQDMEEKWGIEFNERDQSLRKEII